MYIGAKAGTQFSTKICISTVVHIQHEQKVLILEHMRVHKNTTRYDKMYEIRLSAEQ